MSFLEWASEIYFFPLPFLFFALYDLFALLSPPIYSLRKFKVPSLALLRQALSPSPLSLQATLSTKGGDGLTPGKIFAISEVTRIFFFFFTCSGSIFL